MRCEAARGLRPTLPRDPDVFRHSASPLSQLPCATALLRGFGRGRSEQQNRSDIKQRAAPSRAPLEGSLDVLLGMKGLMAGRPDGGTRPSSRGRQDVHWMHVHISLAGTHTYTHTRTCTCTDERSSHMATQSVGDGGKKNSDKIKRAHGSKYNNAIRDSLMILEGRVCGLSLIFPPSLLIPQSLLQREYAE